MSDIVVLCDSIINQSLCLLRNTVLNFIIIFKFVGCESCDCDQVGSLNYTCELETGVCTCKQGVTGRRCDTCQKYYFGFSPTGCQGMSIVWLIN